jgi:kinesin family protein C1
MAAKFLFCLCSSLQMKLSKKEVESIAALEEKLRVAEAQRRKLHNLVQELRGNVRVFARVRPFLPNDGYDLTNEQPSPTIVTKSDLNLLTITRPAGKPDEKGEDQSFTFDKVFGPTCTQEALFDEVSEFVQSALDGYNVCLFSYGQTGSGKVRARAYCTFERSYLTFDGTVCRRTRCKAWATAPCAA